MLFNVICSILGYVLFLVFFASLLLVAWEVGARLVRKVMGKPRHYNTLRKRLYLSAGIFACIYVFGSLVAEEATLGDAYLKGGDAEVERAIVRMKEADRASAQEALERTRLKNEEEAARHAQQVASDEAKKLQKQIDEREKQRAERKAEFKVAAEKLVAFCQWAVMQKAKYSSKASTGWHGYEIYYKQPNGEYWNYMNPKITSFSELKTRISGTIEFMNGFGAYIPHEYQCDFKGETIEAVRVVEGG